MILGAVGCDAALDAGRDSDRRLARARGARLALGVGDAT